MGKSTRELFSDWLNGISPEEQSQDESMKENPPNYPIVEDGGEVQGLPEEDSPKNQFQEWFYSIS